jgi:hypothetical protein
MKLSKLTWFVAGTSLLCAAGAAGVACSDPVNPVPPAPVTPVADTGTAPDTSVPPPPADTGTNSNDTGTGTDAGACAFPPKLRPGSVDGGPKGPFCPFAPKPGADAGVGVNCGAGETCCNGQKQAAPSTSFDPSVCKVGAATACPAPTDPAAKPENFECAEKTQCAAGNVCCFNFSATDQTKTVGSLIDNTTKCPTVIYERGTTCKSACGAKDAQACMTDAECGAGKTCFAVKAGPGGRIDIGICK